VNSGVVVLSVLLALFLLFVMFALFVGSIVVLVKLVRLVFADTDVRLRRRVVLVGAPERVGELESVSAVAGAAGSTVASGGDARDGEPLAVAMWRYRQLLDLGVEPLTAAGAALAGVDTTAVRSLVDHGCSPRLALSILEPDDERD